MAVILWRSYSLVCGFLAWVRCLALDLKCLNKKYSYGAHSSKFS